MTKTKQLMPVEMRAVVDDEVERRFGGAETIKVGCGALVSLINSHPTTGHFWLGLNIKPRNRRAREISAPP